VEVAEELTHAGGVATRAELVRRCGRRDVERALRDGVVVAIERGRYALPSAEEAVQRAHAVTGVLCLSSAAIFHGWGVLTQPERPHVSVPYNRKVRDGGQVAYHRFTLAPDDVVDGIVTSKLTTLTHCLRLLPEPEALAVADSACRAGEGLLVRRAARVARGAGAARVRRLALAASGDAANPFESALRAVALRVPGLHVEPQVLVTSVEPWARVDLADRDLRIVLEADSFEWHGHRAALASDAQRYNRLAVDGWLVLRFTWEDVLFRQEQVRRTLVDAVALVARRSELVFAAAPVRRRRRVA
jgi:very-short-patch-repair endonuclease